ncbi:MAG: prepilin-type N-terminal cleavage/methylation domain-containing protein [Patescibacteria group bacterium]
MKRGFTLVELLVVISIVSMLASIVMVQVSLAQAKGRDSLRTQQIRQIDLATQMYIEANGHAPYLEDLQNDVPPTLCDIQSEIPEESEASACFAVSSQGVDTPAGRAWEAFKKDLAPYMNVPNDPCGSSCASASDFPIGYTYVSPLAMQYYCSYSGCIVTDDSYQLYAPLERESNPSGNSGSSSNYSHNPGSSSGGDGGQDDSVPPSVPANVDVTLNSLWTGGSIGIEITWDASTDDDSGIAGYKVSPLDDNSYSGYDDEGNPIPTDPTPGTSRDTHGLIWSMGMSFCYSVRAYDTAGNPSGPSDEVCTPNIPAFFGAPTGVTAIRQGNQVTVNWNAAANLTSDAVVKYQVYHPGGFLITETTQLSATYDAVGWGNCVRIAPVGYVNFEGSEWLLYNDNSGFGLPPISSATTCASPGI